MIMIFSRTLLFLLAAWIVSLSAGRCNPIYSANGIGMVIPDDAGRPKGMGGAGIADDDGKNLLRENPALLSSFTNHSFSVGVSYRRNTAFTGGADSPDYARTTPDKIKIVLPIVKGVVIGWGLSPYSENDSVIEFRGEGYREIMKSKGGINVSSFGIAGSYKDILRLGVSMNYNFGMIQEEWERSFPDDAEFHTITNYVNRKYKGYSTTVGLVARVFSGTSIGVGYTTESDMDLAVHVIPADYYNPEQVYKKTTVSLPSRWRFGITSAFTDIMTASMDVSLSQWEKAARTVKQKEMYTDTRHFGAGLRFNPSRSFNAPFYRKYSVSAGFKLGNLYYKSYPKVDTVFEKAVTFGIEFPFIENMASLITSFEFGTRGDKSKNGWDESYASIGILLIGMIK